MPDKFWQVKPKPWRMKMEELRASSVTDFIYRPLLSWIEVEHSASHSAGFNDQFRFQSNPVWD